MTYIEIILSYTIIIPKGGLFMKRAGLIASLDIGASIKKLRESRGLSQDELAKDICDRTTITKLENGSSKIPSFIFILQICDKPDPKAQLQSTTLQTKQQANTRNPIQTNCIQRR